MPLVANKKRRFPAFVEPSIFKHPFFDEVLDRPKDFFNINRLFQGISDADFDFSPAVNVKEQPKHYIIEVAAPGYSKDDFEITIENGMLNLYAEKEHQSEEEKEGYVKKEFSYNRFKRSLRLPETIDEEKEVKALYKNGILQLTLQKMEPEKTIPPKKVKVT
ncbi:Hsp20/alpha crystallin family protein [uncultured Planktosalinus sp.]|uniref:Hsp20/alpha crystallin family protein n=1 Tax=uncultured Planktosalinus sp. TaxID=1810935 RepID=UPI0030D8A499